MIAIESLSNYLGKYISDPKEILSVHPGLESFKTIIDNPNLSVMGRRIHLIIVECKVSNKDTSMFVNLPDTIEVSITDEHGDLQVCDSYYKTINCR